MSILIQYSLNVLAAIVIFIAGKWAAGFATRLVERLMIKAQIEPTLAGFAKNISYFLILAFVVIAALNKIGIETTSMIAVIGAAGLAVGLALQGSLANFAAGVMLIIFQPFKVGDYIEASGTSGRVVEIQIFTTVIIEDKKRVIVPNAKITGDKITIHSKSSA